MNNLCHSIDRFLNNSFTVLIIGLILFLTALNSAWNTLSSGLAIGGLGTSHGVMLFGLYMMLQALCRILTNR